MPVRIETNITHMHTIIGQSLAIQQRKLNNEKNALIKEIIQTEITTLEKLRATMTDIK